MKIGQQPFDAQQIKNQLKKLNSPNQPYLEIFDQYQKNMEIKQHQINRLLGYGYGIVNKQNQENQQNNNRTFMKLSTDAFKSDNKTTIGMNKPRTSTIQLDSKNIGMAGILDFNNPNESKTPTKNNPYHNYEGNAQVSSFEVMLDDKTLLQEQNEQLKKKFQDQQSEMMLLRDKNKQLLAKNKKLQKDLQENEDFLVGVKLENANIKELLDDQSAIINDLKKDKEIVVKQKIQLENDYNVLTERYLQDKTLMIEKLNELNQMEEQLRFQMKKLENEQIYLEQQKTEERKSDDKSKSKLENDMQKSGLESSQVGNPKRSIKKLMKYHSNEIYQITQTLNGSLVATCSGDKMIKFFDSLNQNSCAQIELSNNIATCMSFSPNSDTILTGNINQSLQIFSYSSQKLKQQMLGHSEKIHGVAFTCDKQKCVSSSADRTAKVWDMNKGTSVKTISCGSAAKTLESFLAEPLFATGHSDGSIRMYSLREDSVKPVYQINSAFSGPITSLRISNSGNYIICTSQEGTSVKMLDMRTMKIIKSYTDQEYSNFHEYNQCTYGPNEEQIIAGSSNGSIVIWDAQTTKVKDKITNTGHQGVIIACNYHNVTGFLYTGDTRGNFMMWS